MRENEEQCCGTCKWHQNEKTVGWACANPDSEYYADWTEYGDTCEEWEGRR